MTGFMVVLSPEGIYCQTGRFIPVFIVVSFITCLGTHGQGQLSRAIPAPF